MIVLFCGLLPLFSRCEHQLSFVILEYMHWKLKFVCTLVCLERKSCIHCRLTIIHKNHFINLHCYFFIVLQIQLSPFSRCHFSLPHPPPPPTLNPTPVWLCPWVLYPCSLMTLPLLSSVISPLSPLVTVSLFFIYMSLVLFCLPVCFVD